MSDAPLLAFLDTETTGLHVHRGHQPWEVGLVLWDQVDRRVVSEHCWQLPVNEAAADPEALAMNGWHDRRLPDDELTARYEFAVEATRLIDGAPLVGANPAFDERMLAPIFHRTGLGTPWHYRPVDVEAAMFGFFHGRRDALAPFDSTTPDGMPVVSYGVPEAAATAPWSSTRLSEALGVPRDPNTIHSALGDARWTVAVWEAITAAAPRIITTEGPDHG